MMVTISSIDEKKNKITAIGETKSKPFKYGYKSQRTVGGKLKASHSSIYFEITVTLRKITKDEKNMLYKIWMTNQEIELVTEKFEVFTGYIDADSMDPEEKENNGEILSDLTFKIIT